MVGKGLFHTKNFCQRSEYKGSRAEKLAEGIDKWPGLCYYLMADICGAPETRV